VCLLVFLLYVHRLQIYLVFAVFALEERVLYWLPIVSVLVWVWIMFVHARKLRVSGPLFAWVALRSFVLSVLCAGILVILSGLVVSGHADRANKLHKTMKHRADIPAIRAWMAAYHESRSAGRLLENSYGIDMMIRRSEQPECISILDPFFAKYDAKKKQLYLVYGGGFVGQWGLTIVRPEYSGYD